MFETVTVRNFSYCFVSAYYFSQGIDKSEVFWTEDTISLQKIFLCFFKEKDGSFVLNSEKARSNSQSV